PIDFRNQVEGNYTYTKTVYTNLGIFTEEGTMDIVSDHSDEGRLIVQEAATFYGTRVDAVDSSFVFHIPHQALKDKAGNKISIKGIENVNIGNKRGDAGYFPDKNRLQLYYKAEFSENSTLNYTVSILAERKF